MNQAAAVASWWAFVLRYEARETWRSLPGPWPVKIILAVVVVAEPGPFGEMLLAALVAYFRKRRARQT